MQQGTRSVFELSDSRLDISRLRQDLKQAASTILVTLESQVAAEYEGRALERLDCEVYETLARAEGTRLIQEAFSQFAILDASIVQRTGRLVAGEPLYWIGVTAHQAEDAQRALDFLLERMNASIPVWCKAYYRDGSTTWLGQTSLMIDTTQIMPAEEPVQVEKPSSEVPESGTVSSLLKHLTPQVYYQEQLSLSELGEMGQQQLAQAKVLVVGAGSLGSAALQTLAGVGIGTLGLCEMSRLEMTDLHRQMLYSTNDIGKNKAILAVERLQALNPLIHLQMHPKKLNRHNVQTLFEAYDLVLDCTNDHNTRVLLNEAAVAFHKPLIQACTTQWSGWLHVYKPNESACLRCQTNLMPESPASGGKLGILATLLGSWQALEAVKLLLGLPSPLINHCMILDALSCQQQFLLRQKNAYCPVCQPQSNVKSEIEKPAIAAVASPAEMKVPEVPDWAIFIHPNNKALLSEFILVDVSEAREHTTFPGHPSLNFPFSRFDLNHPMLDREHRYLLYCQKGSRSMHLARELRNRGYRNVYVLAGGFLQVSRIFEASTSETEIVPDMVAG